MDRGVSNITCISVRTVVSGGIVGVYDVVNDEQQIKMKANVNIRRSVSVNILLRK